jgi:NAD(P)-dependent dehydrogenase (short-subunit alcohol dehydrogenase family)
MSIVEARELGRYGVRTNAIAPPARTRLMATVGGMVEHTEPPTGPNKFDVWGADNVSPLVAYLATNTCPFSGQVFSGSRRKRGDLSGLEGRHSSRERCAVGDHRIERSP